MAVDRGLGKIGGGCKYSYRDVHLKMKKEDDEVRRR